jgi:PIN domain
MSARKGIVLDANLLVRAVFGHRVLHLLETYEDRTRFYAPDVCFQDALRYIPLISKQRGLNAELRVFSLQEISPPWNQSTAAFTNSLSAQLANVSLSEIRTTGRSLQSRFSLTCRFGLRIRISSEVASPPGQPIEWRCISENLDWSDSYPELCTLVLPHCYSSNFRRIIQFIRMGSPAQ